MTGVQTCALPISAGALSLMGAAWATPPGVTEKDGAFVAPDGKPLYTFARDATPGKSACNGQCAANWQRCVPRASQSNYLMGTVNSTMWHACGFCNARHKVNAAISR